MQKENRKEGLSILLESRRVCGDFLDEVNWCRKTQSVMGGTISKLALLSWVKLG